MKFRLLDLMYKIQNILYVLFFIFMVYVAIILFGTVVTVVISVSVWGMMIFIGGIIIYEILKP